MSSIRALFNRLILQLVSALGLSIVISTGLNGFEPTTPPRLATADSRLSVIATLSPTHDKQLGRYIGEGQLESFRIARGSQNDISAILRLSGLAEKSDDLLHHIEFLRGNGRLAPVESWKTETFPRFFLSDNLGRFFLAADAHGNNRFVIKSEVAAITIFSRKGRIKRTIMIGDLLPDTRLKELQESSEYDSAYLWLESIWKMNNTQVVCITRTAGSFVPGVREQYLKQPEWRSIVVDMASGKCSPLSEDEMIATLVSPTDIRPSEAIVSAMEFPQSKNLLQIISSIQERSPDTFQRMLAAMVLAEAGLQSPDIAKNDINEIISSGELWQGNQETRAVEFALARLDIIAGTEIVCEIASQRAARGLSIETFIGPVLRKSELSAEILSEMQNQKENLLLSYGAKKILRHIQELH